VDEVLLALEKDDASVDDTGPHPVDVRLPVLEGLEVDELALRI
jgi:hypothetical protein